MTDARRLKDEHWICSEHAISRWLLAGTTVSGEHLRVRGCDLFDLAPDERIRWLEEDGSLSGAARFE
jgi:hypothetical protein